jgi:hypothetical protein
MKSEGGPNILKVDEVKEFHNFKNQYEWLEKIRTMPKLMS